MKISNITLGYSSLARVYDETLNEGTKMRESAYLKLLRDLWREGCLLPLKLTLLVEVSIAVVLSAVISTVIYTTAGRSPLKYTGKSY